MFRFDIMVNSRIRCEPFGRLDSSQRFNDFRLSSGYRLRHRRKGSRNQYGHGKDSDNEDQKIVVDDRRER